MASVLAVREQYDDRVMLTKLTSLGLSLEAAVDMRAQEKKIAQVYEMMAKEDQTTPCHREKRNLQVTTRVDENDDDDFKW